MEYLLFEICVLNWTKIGLKLVQMRLKLVQNWAKIDRILVLNLSKKGPELVENQTKIGQKSTLKLV